MHLLNIGVSKGLIVEFSTCEADKKQIFSVGKWIPPLINSTSSHKFWSVPKIHIQKDPSILVDYCSSIALDLSESVPQAKQSVLLT